jgi:hypothetical protein
MRTRPFVLVAVALALVLAGCMSPGSTVDKNAAPGGGGSGSSPEAAPGSPTPAPGQPPAQNGSPGKGGNQSAPPRQNASGNASNDPTFCAQASGCTFWDDDYHEYTLYDVDTYQLDVLIVPSASPGRDADTAVIKEAILAWGAGIQTLGAKWFASNFTMNVYVLGTDTPPQSAIQDPEIIVLAAEYNPVLLFGIGEQLPATPCRGAATHTYAPHVHDGMTVYAADCQAGGLTCVAVNTNNLGGGKASLYDLVAHEFGHCLGGGHVGDALDFSAKRVPVHDIMSYQHDATQVHCVSNLNLRVLEALYAPLLGANVTTPLKSGDFYLMHPVDYVQTTCANPT